MRDHEFRAKAEQLLAFADVRINGDRPWDIQVDNEKMYRRVFADPTVGMGESYMDGWWDCSQLDQFFCRVTGADLDKKLPLTRALILGAMKARLFNLQRKSRAFEIGAIPYDIGNDQFKNMLDNRMVYSCAYWKDAQNLDDAQEAKLDLVCRKLGLQKGMKVLDIGSGWGGFAKYAAERYGVEVVGITVSKKQLEYSTEQCRGLPVEIRLQDYREVNQTFDRIVSIGMFEHVGYKNYKRYMRINQRNLADDGLFLLHTIGSSQTVIYTDSWMHKYIFPAGDIPSARQLCDALEGLFVIEDWHNFGADYDKTLMAWYQNFHRSWEAQRSRFGDRFYRMWKYYLLSSAGSFRARKSQLWQIVLSKNGVPGGYQSIR